MKLTKTQIKRIKLNTECDYMDNNKNDCKSQSKNIKPILILEEDLLLFACPKHYGKTKKLISERGLTPLEIKEIK